MDLTDFHSKIESQLKLKFLHEDLSKFGIEFHSDNEVFIVCVDEYYFIAIRNQDGKSFLKAKTLGMSLESSWYLILDEDKVLKRVINLLVQYIMRDKRS